METLTEPIENKTSTKTKNDAATTEQVAVKKKNKIFTIILAVLVSLGGFYGVSKYIHAQNNEETEDAQVNGNISPVIPRIAGYVSKVWIKDNQFVKKGDTLVMLDDREMRIKVLQAQAALDNAKSSLNVAHANTTAAQASTVSSQSNINTADAN